MTKKKYDSYGHMVQLGKVSSLMQASVAITRLILKEKKALKKFEQQKLLQDIKKKLLKNNINNFILNINNFFNFSILHFIIYFAPLIQLI